MTNNGSRLSYALDKVANGHPKQSAALAAGVPVFSLSEAMMITGLRPAKRETPIIRQDGPELVSKQSLLDMSNAELMTLSHICAKIVRDRSGSPADKTAAIIRSVAVKHGVSVETILGRDKTKEVCAARHEAVYEVRKNTRLSLPQMGLIFHRDHTTLISSIRRHERTLSHEHTARD